MIVGDPDEIVRALDAGLAVVLPFPTPLPYVVAGTTPAAVNRAKGRPADQPTGLGVADFALVAPHLALDAATAGLAGRLTDELLLNLFLPVVDGAPAWLRPAAATGLVGVTTACLDATRPILERYGHLVLSSGNRTGGRVAVTAAEADAEFGGELTVLDGDAARDPSVPCGSAAIVVVRPGGVLELARDGVQSAGRDPAEFLAELVAGRR